MRSPLLAFSLVALSILGCHESATAVAVSTDIASPPLGPDAVVARPGEPSGTDPASASSLRAGAGEIATRAPGAATDAAATPASDPAPAPSAPEDDEAGVRGPTEWRGDDSLAGNRRAEAAIAHKQKEVESMFADAGVAFPPKELLWRVFKDKQHLEVWANDAKGAPMKKIATYRACAMSGGLGPKHREGDRQVPEGFYRIEYFFPDSAFHLAAKVSYPNALDRVLGDPVPGGDIMIHGGCASIGCIALTDERIEELWVIGSSVIYKGEPIHVHIFPSRDMDALIDDDAWAKNKAFWENLREGLNAFEADKRLPNIKIGFHRKYEVAALGS